MLKAIKWTLRLVVLGIIAFGVGFVYFNYIDKGDVLRADQQEIIAVLGYPEQFSITYMPKGTEEAGVEFIRHENWFYPSMKTKVTFLGGALVSKDELLVASEAEYQKTELIPQSFSHLSSIDNVDGLIGDYALEPVELPVFFGEGVETYAYAGGVFVFENGYLTYMETLD